MKPVSSPQSPECDHRSTEKGVYVASRASIPQRSAMWRSLRNEGWNITSSWIDEAGEGETADFGELWDRIMREIATAEKVVLYAEPGDFPLKGAILEAGIALGMGKPVIVCLPGVELEGRTKRPLGSWIEHRNVTRCDNLLKAMASPPAHQENSPRSAPESAPAQRASHKSGERLPSSDAADAGADTEIQSSDGSESSAEKKINPDPTASRLQQGLATSSNPQGSDAAAVAKPEMTAGTVHPACVSSGPSEPAPQVREALANRLGKVAGRTSLERDREIIIEACNALRALTPVVAREPVGWRTVDRRKAYTGMVTADPKVRDVWLEAGIKFETLYTSPPPASAVREALEKAAQIVDAEAARILSKQEPTTDPLSIMDTVNMHLRMMACALPEVATAIRALSSKGADLKQADETSEKSR